METITYLIPFFVAIILLVACRKNIVWWEYASIILISVLLTFGMRSCCVAFQEEDTEYLGGYMTKITHYDEWDEWVVETCEREVYDGEDANGNAQYHTETYDCSHREYHRERWTYTTNNGHEEYFYEKSDFDRAMKELGYPEMVFKEMNRDYYKIDGDAQEYYWDGQIQHVRPLVYANSYTNKINCSNSIFNFEDISDEEADEMGLFRYPEIIDDDQNIIMGIKPSKVTHKKYKYINAVYGSRNQFRIYVLVYQNKPIDISEKQKHYWKGGNKNEFVLCLGYDTISGRITWCNPFSWSDKPDLEVATKRYFREHPRMDLSQYPEFLMKNIHLWKRKEFKDFDYIENEPTSGQNTAILIFIIIFDIILALIAIFNEFANREEYYSADGNKLVSILMQIMGIVALLVEELAEVLRELAQEVAEMCASITNWVKSFIENVRKNKQ